MSRGGSSAVFVVLLVACSGPRPPVPITMAWTPVDSLNARLPAGVRVFYGEDGTVPLRAWYVRVASGRETAYTRVVMSDDRSDNRETVASFSEEADACVAVNGGYFTMNQTPARHAGLLVTDGRIREHATRWVTRDSTRYETVRAAIGFLPTGEVAIGWAGTRNDSAFVWASPPGNAPGAPAPPPDVADATPWSVHDALGAGPVLVEDGRIRVAADEEVFFGSSIPDVHPRTAAGRAANGDLLLMVVDGRQVASRGVDLQELATLMRDVGAVDAMNLDGGGSSTMVVNGILVNRPAGDVIQRQVMSALVTYCPGGVIVD